MPASARDCQHLILEKRDLEQKVQISFFIKRVKLVIVVQKKLLITASVGFMSLWIGNVFRHIQRSVAIRLTFVGRKGVDYQKFNLDEIGLQTVINGHKNFSKCAKFKHSLSNSQENSIQFCLVLIMCWTESPIYKLIVKFCK